MSEGKLTVRLFGRDYKGSWRIVRDRVEVTAEVGTDSALLGSLASAPASVAREKLMEMVKAAERSARPRAGMSRFDIRDA